MNIAILGYDTEGKVSYDYFAAQGHTITICDQNPDLVVPEGVTSVLGEAYLDDLDRFAFVVRTAGLSPRKILAKNPGLESKITTGTNEFLKVCPTKNVIGVTGTKGKGTTSTLITRLLEASGKTVHLGGNIGVPALNLLSNDIQPDDYVVLELSSFQLTDLKQSPHIAVCLMVVPEHLDWHPDINDYTMAKSNLFAHQMTNDIAIYYVENELSRLIAAHGEGRKLTYFAPPGALVENGAVKIDGQVICQTDELKLLGEHNWQNVCAAVTAVWQISQDISAMREVLTSFVGLPFRIEFRRETNGIKYYNDSFGSQPSATVAALHSIPGTKVMIIGGFERGLDLRELAEALHESQDEVRHALLIGATGQRVADNLQGAGFTKFTVSGAKTMPEVVAEATKLAQPGDSVVLSPGFASYDMFKNFEDRGQQFNAAVEAL